MTGKNAVSAMFDTIIDKVVLAALVTAVSTFLFYGYTAYNKAFENIQAQSRATSDLAIRLRDSVLKQTDKLTGDIKLAYLSGKNLTDKEYKSALSLVGDISRNAQILSAIFPDSSKIALNLASTLQKDLFFFQLKSVTEARLKAMEGEVATQLRNFIGEFNKEMGAAAAKEFRDIFNAFHETMPWQFQPFYIVLGCFAILIALLAAAQIWRKLTSGASEPPPSSQTPPLH
ncbi:hypothetical protein [Pseudorhodoplanes sp.]|uniref:hypothetical protein n=1 Tax=Pseudorhodoplanes sp. TaxID=1934341 RepID=UPI002C3BC830|nr:hypothetical protein [Pseudorhodoplanes sp.]HWV54754.1 hypothetical protein [Pseudorhodoplanes sp.]